MYDQDELGAVCRLIAERARKRFIYKTRPDGSEFVATDADRGGFPGWLYGALRAAHEGALPDDQIYEWAVGHLENFGDTQAEDWDSLDDLIESSTTSLCTAVPLNILSKWLGSAPGALGFLEDVLQDLPGCRPESIHADEVLLRAYAEHCARVARFIAEALHAAACAQIDTVEDEGHDVEALLRTVDRDSGAIREEAVATLCGF